MGRIIRWILIAETACIIVFLIVPIKEIRALSVLLFLVILAIGLQAVGSLMTYRSSKNIYKDFTDKN